MDRPPPNTYLSPEMGGHGPRFMRPGCEFSKVAGIVPVPSAKTFGF